MKHFKARILALCGLMVLIAAALAPIVAEAEYGSCPDVIINCGPFYGPHSCSGRSDGNGHCLYDATCMSCPH
jgi:hypothetical protein